jgi:uncharacterized protein YecE (DUF72 family)
VIWIGTSGWQYSSWKGTYYPPDVPQSRWLEFYAQHFQTQEVNNAFYRLPKAETFAAWAERTPDDFVMVVKMSRYLTHIKRLRDADEPVQRFMERARCLGSKLGPVLLQLPPNLQAERLPELDHTLSLFPRDVRVAVEFRHESWFTDATYDVLRRYNAAFCLADSPKRRVPVVRTADWGYLRLHEGKATPRPCYGEKALDNWAATVADVFAGGEDVFVFFNNDPRACALRDAVVFAKACERHGLPHTRVPGRRDVRVATG